MQDVIDAYEVAATPSLISIYDTLSVEAIYQHVIDLFPKEAARVLDVGAGTGRDAAWLAEKGHTVLAVEPVGALREAGKQLHPSTSIQWLDGRLPDLKIPSSAGQFDLVLLGGVWQHLNEAGQKTAMPNLAALTAPAGRLVMSLRHGPAAGDRRVFPIDPALTATTAKQCGLRLIRRREANSIQQENHKMGVHWTWLVFENLH